MKRSSLVLALTGLIAITACNRPTGSEDSDRRVAADKVLQSKADSGDVAAMLSLASNVSGHDQAAAFALLLKAADAGSPQAGYDVAMRYREGIGIRKNYKASRSWMEKAAKGGHLQARYEVAVQRFFRSSKNITEILSERPRPDRELTDNFAEFKALSELGVKDATVFVALILHIGITSELGDKTAVLMPEDDLAARKLLLPLAMKGNARAQRWLAFWSEEQGTRLASPASAAAGEDWWEKLAAQKDGHELYEAGMHFSNGWSDEKSYAIGPGVRFRGQTLTFYEAAQQALAWFEKSAQLGDPDGMLAAARLYEKGWGTPKDPQASFKWLKKAAEGGSPDAQLALSSAYGLGTGVVTDEGRSLEWAMALATHPTADLYDMAEGQGSVAFHYWFTPGDVDPVLAYAWVNIATASGNDEYRFLKEKIEKKISPRDLQEAQRLSGAWKPGEKIVRIDAKASENAGSSSTKKVSVQGTGFFINKAGDILTNHHVVDGCSEIRLPALPATATVLVADKANDLAVIRTTSKPASVPAIADPAKVKQGQEIVVFGFPLGGFLPATGNVSIGLVSALAGPGNNSSLIQISAPVQQGNSGGPVLDHKGNVVGVVVAKADAIRIAKVTGDVLQNVNFAVAIGTVRTFLDTNGIGFDSPTWWWSASKNPSELADITRVYTLKIECVR